jgi:hypothetical protein
MPSSAFFDGESILIGDMRLITNRQGNRGSSENVVEELYHVIFHPSWGQTTFACAADSSFAI